MKTDDFISLLATGVTPVSQATLARRFCIALLIGVAGTTVMVASIFGIRPDLAQVATRPMFWAKVALPLCLMIGSLLVSTRLARPGVAAGKRWVLVGLPVAVVWIAASYLLTTVPADERLPMILGKTWRGCPFYISMLSVPAFIAVFWALRGLAPTRLALTGAAGGLLAGSTATLAYCLHCPEMGVAFWGAWYLLGMLVPTVVGALLGPRLLRW
jgi:hypothetical protein